MALNAKMLVNHKKIVYQCCCSTLRITLLILFCLILEVEKPVSFFDEMLIDPILSTRLQV